MKNGRISDRVTLETSLYVSLAAREINRLEKKFGNTEIRLINFLIMITTTIFLPTQIIHFGGKHNLPVGRLRGTAILEYD